MNAQIDSIDEVTGLEFDPTDRPPPAWLVTDGMGRAYSFHQSRASAYAWINWYAPEMGLQVEEI